MQAITTHYAKTHLSRLLKEVQMGETFVIMHGREPAGTLSGVAPGNRRRPRVGRATSAPVHCTPDAFDPASDAELQTWGL